MAGQDKTAEERPAKKVMAMKNLFLAKSKTIFLFIVLLFFAPVASSGEQLSIDYARGFSVEYIENATLVTVTNPWPGAKIDFKYLLKKRASPTPVGYEDYQVVEVPVERTIALSTTFLAFVEELDLLDTLVGFSDLSPVHSHAVLRAARENPTLETGQGPNLQVETVLDLEPGIVFTFATGSFRDAHPKLIEAGLDVAVVGEYMESHPLGRAEWIKFLALFYNKQEEATRVFTQLENRYLNLAAKTATLQHRPTVISGVPFSGRWFVAGGNSFVARLLHDAGGDYVWKETDHTGSQPMDIELVYERGIDAEFWLNTGIWATLEQAREADPRFLEFRSLQQGNLYNNNKRIKLKGGNDYWESGMMAPDVILADLIHILNPQLLPEHKLFYYTHLK